MGVRGRGVRSRELMGWVLEVGEPCEVIKAVNMRGEEVGVQGVIGVSS